LLVCTSHTDSDEFVLLTILNVGATLLVVQYTLSDSQSLLDHVPVLQAR